jgi:glutamate N-acetyltransferase/amino-acid N-acetyltransferase
MADEAALHLGVEPDLMLVASTGVIGVALPTDRVKEGIGRLRPTRDGGHDAARAIMTTDLVPKEVAYRGLIGQRGVIVGGMAKGSGMIHPAMGTLLAVLTTDAAVQPELARAALRRAADRSFNQVSIDGDTSTNDTVVLLASGQAGGPVIRSGTRAAGRFLTLLETACVALARMIARDGEGASRLIEVVVEGARSPADAGRVARAIASSNLVKAAVHGQDPNWGRIAMAVGNAGVPIDQDRMDIYVGEHQVARSGEVCRFERAAVASAMGAEEVVLRVCLNSGRASGKAWGCDLTEGYVKINAEYTT